MHNNYYVCILNDNDSLQKQLIIDFRVVYLLSPSRLLNEQERFVRPLPQAAKGIVLDKSAKRSGPREPLHFYIMVFLESFVNYPKKMN